MTERDKEIIRAVERFRCLSRKQIESMFFAHCRQSKNTANNVLKRLRDRKYLTIAPYRRPYVYLPNPSKIRKDSNKIDHYLAIADVYLQLRRRVVLKKFDIEPRYDADIRPDILAIFGNAPFFFEVQNSEYSHRIMQKKIELYEHFYVSGKWRNLEWQKKGNEFFPYIILLTEKRYDIQTINIGVFQYKNIADFLAAIQK